MILKAIENIPFLCVEFSSAVLLTCALFRIPLRCHAGKIVFITLVLSVISYYVRDVNNMFNYSVMIVLSCYVLLFVILFRMQFLFALLSCVTGYLAASIIQVAIGSTAIYAGITTPDLIENSKLHDAILQLSTGLVSYLLVYVLQKRKIGFLFPGNHSLSKQPIGKIHFVLSGILFFSVIVIQLAVLSFKVRSVHFIALGGLLAVLSIALVWSYKHNKSLLTEKYERLRKRP